MIRWPHRVTLMASDAGARGERSGGAAPPGDPGYAQRAASPPGLPSAARCLVMGVVNVTPDSFSDGGSWFGPDAAIARGLELAAQGADIVDVGGESTPPGAQRGSGDEGLRGGGAGRSARARPAGPRRAEARRAAGAGGAAR